MCNENTRRKKKKKTEEIFEVIMIEMFPTLMTDIKLYIQEAQRTLRRININN